MARILNNAAEWFEQVEPTTFSESEFEDRVLLHAPAVYPEYIVMPFKQTVSSSYGSAKPDLVFIAKDYCEWRVVEVEMSYHSLSGHVEPQIQRLADAVYGKEVVAYLCSRNPALDRGQLSTLITTIPPQILLIVNAARPDWVAPLSKYRAILAVFELFRSESGHEIFRVDGEYPSLLVAVISRCFFHPFVPRMLGVADPDALDLPLRGRIRLRYNNCVTEWTRLDADGKVWLSPTGRSPLHPQTNYEIYRQSDGALVLRQLESI